MTTPSLNQLINNSNSEISAAVAKYDVKPNEVVFLNDKGEVLKRGNLSQPYTADQLPNYDIPTPGHGVLPSGVRTIIANGNLTMSNLGCTPFLTENDIYPYDGTVTRRSPVSALVNGNFTATGSIHHAATVQVNGSATVNSSEGKVIASKSVSVKGTGYSDVTSGGDIAVDGKQDYGTLTALGQVTIGKPGERLSLSNAVLAEIRKYCAGRNFDGISVTPGAATPVACVGGPQTQAMRIP